MALLQQIRVVCTADGLVPVLQQMAGPRMPPGDLHPVPGQPRLHTLAERALARAPQERAVVRQQGPGLHAQLPVPAQRGDPGHELGPVGVIGEARGARDAPAHAVV